MKITLAPNLRISKWENSGVNTLQASIRNILKEIQNQYLFEMEDKTIQDCFEDKAFLKGKVMLYT
jgi:hypothetical protein